MIAVQWRNTRVLPTVLSKESSYLLIRDELQENRHYNMYVGKWERESFYSQDE